MVIKFLCFILCAFTLLNSCTSTAGQCEIHQLLDEKMKLCTIADSFSQLKRPIVSAIGPEHIGKSTLLNFLFDTKFEMMGKSFNSGATTNGIDFSIVGNQNLIAMDVEGFGGTAKASKNLEKDGNIVSSMALILSHVLILNVALNSVTHQFWKDTLSAILCFYIQNLEHQNLPKKTIIFAVRDTTAANDKAGMRTYILKNALDIWENARETVQETKDLIEQATKESNPSASSSGTPEKVKFEDFFNVEVVFLPNLQAKDSSAATSVSELRETIQKATNKWNAKDDIYHLSNAHDLHESVTNSLHLTYDQKDITNFVKENFTSIDAAKEVFLKGFSNVALGSSFDQVMQSSLKEAQQKYSEMIKEHKIPMSIYLQESTLKVLLKKEFSDLAFNFSCDQLFTAYETKDAIKDFQIPKCLPQAQSTQIQSLILFLHTLKTLSNPIYAEQMIAFIYSDPNFTIDNFIEDQLKSLNSFPKETFNKAKELVKKKIELLDTNDLLGGFVSMRKSSSFPVRAFCNTPKVKERFGTYFKDKDMDKLQLDIEEAYKILKPDNVVKAGVGLGGVLCLIHFLSSPPIVIVFFIIFSIMLIHSMKNTNLANLLNNSIFSKVFGN